MARLTGRARICVVVAMVAVVAACGGESDQSSGDRTFSDEKFAITFTYPRDFRKGNVTDVAEQVGEPMARATIGLDADNLISLSKYELNAAVTSANLSEALSELDGVVARLAKRPVSGTLTEVGGLSAVRYDGIALDDPEGRESRFLFVFDQEIEYQLNCQSTPEKRARMNQACDQMVATLRPA